MGDTKNLSIIETDLLLKLLNGVGAKPPVDPNLAEMANADKQINAVLASDATDRTKLDAYNELVAVKGVHADRYDGPRSNRARTAGSVARSGDSLERAVKARLLTTKQHAALDRLLAFARARKGAVVDWDESTGGGLTVRGRSIPGANIGDVLVELIRTRKATQGKIPGAAEFADMLRTSRAAGEKPFAVNPFYAETTTTTKKKRKPAPPPAGTSRRPASTPAGSSVDGPKPPVQSVKAPTDTDTEDETSDAARRLAGFQLTSPKFKATPSRPRPSEDEDEGPSKWASVPRR